MGNEKTYVAGVAFEAIAYNDVIVAEPTSRLEALLGAGYLHEVSGPVYAVSPVEAGPADDAEEDTALLERFEDADVVEKRKRGRPRKER